MLFGIKEITNLKTLMKNDMFFFAFSVCRIYVILIDFLYNYVKYSVSLYKINYSKLALKNIIIIFKQSTVLKKNGIVIGSQGSEVVTAMVARPGIVWPIVIIHIYSFKLIMLSHLYVVPSKWYFVRPHHQSFFIT